MHSGVTTSQLCTVYCYESEHYYCLNNSYGKNTHIQKANTLLKYIFQSIKGASTLWCFFRCWRQCIRYCWLLSISQSVPDAVSSTSESSSFTPTSLQGQHTLNSLQHILILLQYLLIVRSGTKIMQTHKNKPLLFFSCYDNSIANTVQYTSV